MWRNDYKEFSIYKTKNNMILSCNISKNVLTVCVCKYIIYPQFCFHILHLRPLYCIFNELFKIYICPPNAHLLMKFQLVLIVTMHQGQSLNEYLSVMNIHLVYVFTKSFKIDKAINKHFHAHFNSGLTCFLQHHNFRQGKLCMSVPWPRGL